MIAKSTWVILGPRPTSDIDLLVHEEDLEKAELAVKNIGYIIEETRIPLHFHSSFSKPIPMSSIPLTVEVPLECSQRENI